MEHLTKRRNLSLTLLPAVGTLPVGLLCPMSFNMKVLFHLMVFCFTKKKEKEREQYYKLLKSLKVSRLLTLVEYK